MTTHCITPRGALRASLFVGFLVLVAATAARATTYTCTTAAQLTSALNSVLPGDTVVISGALTGNFVANRSGTAASPITVQGDGTAVLSSSSGYGFEVVNASYYRLQNFIIQGGLKGLVIDNANHGIVDHVHCRNIQQEAFKIRNQSQWWEFTYCSARNTGTSGDFGEGFYTGQASSNWINGVPDASGFVTFFNCYATDTVNDGWDCKEGSHDIKMVNCTADYSGSIEPASGAAHGSAGFYLRADRIQVIKCNVIHLDNSDWAYRFANELINGTDYGSSGNEVKQSVATLGNVGLIYSEAGTNAKVYDDWSETSSGGFYATGSQTVAIPAAATFVERTWAGEGGGTWGDLDANIGADGDPLNANIVAAPVFTPGGGTYTSAQSVTITTTTTGASIRYTTDGSAPSSTVGTLYTGPVSIAANTTLKAIAYKTGMSDSTITTATYAIQVAAPVFTPGGGTYTSAQSVTITTATTGASIRYTTDGSTPSSTVGTLYTGPVSIATTTTLKAIAYQSGLTDSTVTSATYTIQVGDFTISATPSSRTITKGGSTTYTVTVTGTGGFTGTVNLSVSGLPLHGTGTFNPASVAGSGNSTLNVTTTRKTPAGTSTLTITGTSGSLTHSTTVSLIVQ